MKQKNKEYNTVDIITDETTESERSNEIMNKDKKNKLSHLSFEEYFESDWRKHFQIARDRAEYTGCRWFIREP
jgi:hypothetical protein